MNTDSSDDVNLQRDDQNPHDAEQSRQQGHAEDLNLPKSTDAYVAEYRSNFGINNDYVDSENRQRDDQNPHDAEQSRQQGHAGDLNLLKTVDEYAAEYRSRFETNYLDTVNIQQPDSQNPHDPGSNSYRQNSRQHPDFGAGMLVSDSRTADRILDNGETARHSRSSCEIPKECDIPDDDGDMF